MAWKIGIALFLATVVAVNVAFIWVAVSGADAVDPSYTSESR